MLGRSSLVIIVILGTLLFVLWSSSKEVSGQIKAPVEQAQAMGLSGGGRFSGIETAVLGSGKIFLPAFLNPFPQGTFLGQIVFSSERSGTGFYELFVMDATGAGLTPIVQGNVENVSPSWSPNNSHIVFVKGDASNNSLDEIYKVDADGTNLVRLTNNNVPDSAPKWSPDGSKIIFSSFRNSATNIFVMDSDGTNETQLTFSAVGAGSQTWSPDGTKIAYTTKDDNYNDVIVIMNADGSNPDDVYTSGTLGFGGLTWSPDGSKFAFSSFSNGFFDIFTINVNGTGLKQLTMNQRYNFNPSWSPDGGQIVFASDRGNLNYNFDIYIMYANGSSQQNISLNGSAHDRYPAWSN